MSIEPLLAAVAQAVFDYLLRETDLAERVRAVLGIDPQRRAFQTALARAYTAFARQYPHLVASLFDERFLTQEGAPILAQLLTRRGRPDPAELARRWARHLSYPDPATWPRLADATRAAADFLTWLEAELAEQPALQSLWDSRALERIAENTEAIRRALENVLAQRYTPADVELIRRTLAQPSSTVVTGERAVAIGGSADGAVIITGDLKITLNARQRADLQRLLAAKMHNVPPLPDHYLPREEYLAPLRQALLGDSTAPLGIVGVHGMGGIGKSVLAAALAHDLQVQAAFPDGIIWLSIGREPNLPARQEDLYLILTGERENFKDAAQGRLFLNQALPEKACLVILDDVWEARHAEAFPRLPPGARARYLLTTRNSEILQTLGAQIFSLDVLSEEQALTLLADWAGQPRETLPPEARAVAQECGYLPLALAMVGAFVRRNPESWARALRRLRTADLEKLRTLFPGYEHPTLLAALAVSVEALPETARERYLDLAVFPEEAAIPLPILRAFWAPLGLDEDDIDDLVTTFVDRSLARRDEAGALRLHDLQHDYLRATQRDDLPDLHRRFLLACAESLLGERTSDLEGLPWHRLPPGTPYLWDHLVYHHMGAGAWDALYGLLTDFHFLEARCRVTSVFDLEADYRLALARWPQADAERRAVLAAFEERLRLEEHHIARHPDYLFPALYNHLTWLDAPDGPLHRLCEAAREGRRNWLRSRLDPRPEPPLWTRSLEGHTGPVRAVAVTADGRWAVSGSDDKTVKVWDLESGWLCCSLEGHTGPVYAVAVTPDGRWAISGSGDRTVKVWDLESRWLLRSLEGHTKPVTAVAVTPDGRWAVSGSADGTVKIWDLESGRLLRSLESHTGPVYAVAVTPDERWAISGSWDRTVKVWDLESGRLLRSLEGHTGPVKAVAVTPDGRWAISGSNDKTVKVWDLESGRLLRSLEGHTDWVRAVAVTPDGHWAISGSDDHTVKVWDLESGQLCRFLEGHTKLVTAVAVTPDGRWLISGSDDKMVKVWNLESGASRLLFWNDTAILSLALSPDGRALVCGDAAGRVWLFDWVW
ncbi:NB-ARC domain-containing protein [Thermoflexus sp.]|uniref:NB-ARC domain-containing protein n=1 Tax=Thermoflexus sp. TaxID=1969742 RepID=UPI0035E46015